MKKISLGIIYVLLVSTAAQAQYVDPLNCMPPMGQQLYEIAARNLTMNYKQNPTAANKKKMCDRYKSVVSVYQKAVVACERSSCEEASFQNICQKKADKLEEWKDNYAALCRK